MAARSGSARRTSSTRIRDAKAASRSAAARPSAPSATGDLGEAAQIRYGELPQLEREIETATETLAELQREQRC